MDRFEAMADRVQLDLESYGLRQTIDGRRRVIAEALRAAYERGVEEGRAKGREDVGKYSNAIGRIEAALGYAGARPLSETVRAVEALQRDREQSQLIEGLPRFGRARKRRASRRRAMSERWNLAPVEPIGKQAFAFVTPGGLEEVEMPVYPEATRESGERLRRARVALGIGLRKASQRLGLTAAEISAVERGAMTGDIEAMIAAIREGAREALLDAWPGDETDEELLAALRELDGKREGAEGGEL